jgi:simple sugar transport system ATP-binding protein
VLQRRAQWLLFDEPTAVLSPDESEGLFRVLENLRSEGRGILFISHKLREVLRLCDRVTVLRRGRVVGERARGVTAAELGAMLVEAEGEDKVQLRDRAETEKSEGRGAGNSALEVRELWVRDERGVAAVRGLSFEVRSGEIFGIAGVDGNGQTELGEAVVGLRRTHPGSISQPASIRRSKGCTGARPGYIPGDRRRAGVVLPMSVRENLILEIHAAPGFRWGPMLRLGRLWAAASEMAHRFDVRARDQRQPAVTLSGGNQQKIVVARALYSKRSLLVAVNPTRGLDIAATGFVHAQLRAARDAGMGVLLISTDLDELLDLSDRLGVLFEGRLQGVVPPSASRQRIGHMMGGGGDETAEECGGAGEGRRQGA